MNKDNQLCSVASSVDDIHYHTKENISRACTDIFEDILRKAYDIDEPLATLPDKCTTGIQASSSETKLANNRKRIE